MCEEDLFCCCLLFNYVTIISSSASTTDALALEVDQTVSGNIYTLTMNGAHAPMRPTKGSARRDTHDAQLDVGCAMGRN